MPPPTNPLKGTNMPKLYTYLGWDGNQAVGRANLDAATAKMQTDNLVMCGYIINIESHDEEIPVTDEAILGLVGVPRGMPDPRVAT